MTVVYFVRHAQADRSIRDGKTRPLTERGIKDSLGITVHLEDKNIHKVVSSPFRRAFDTISDFANKHGMSIEIVQDFRERKSDSDWKRGDDFWPFVERLWHDFNFTLSDGECLREVQERNIAALTDVLDRYSGMNIVIGTHGTALATIIHYYDDAFGFEDYKKIANRTPWIVKMIFDGLKCISIEDINV